MKFLVILVALIAVAAGQMALPFGSYAAGVSPMNYAYSAPFTFANPQAYGAAPTAYAAAPVAYSAAAAPFPYVAPGPISYQTGAKVVAKYEPVEQHGYQIAY
ncbi:uncharacterized protein LOC124321120 [Daphnia pulicaria]|uniref:uncharacterized protein LOC124321120 n=1 Tax=Daphnia pulicaria TaxID=35523 RepID=UPI001EEBA210|nr:uncharacterized protein LOC124321120 [Daphnia pulicaria]